MSEIGALAWYITLLWILALVLIEYWISTLKRFEEKEAKHK
jgi:hypothetical protein